MVKECDANEIPHGFLARPIITTAKYTCLLITLTKHSLNAKGFALLLQLL